MAGRATARGRPRRVGAPTMQNVRGSRRADGTLLTASIPTLSLDIEEEEAAAAMYD